MVFPSPFKQMSLLCAKLEKKNSFYSTLSHSLLIIIQYIYIYIYIYTHTHTHTHPYTFIALVYGTISDTAVHDATTMILSFQFDPLVLKSLAEILGVVWRYSRTILYQCFEPQWSLYVALSLTITNCMYCPHCTFGFSEQMTFVY